MSIMNDIVGTNSGNGNRQTTSYNYAYRDGDGAKVVNWGEQASRSLYSVFANQNDTKMVNRNLLNSRLWHGVPQLTIDQMNMFEAAYTGHTFIFVVDVPKFMYTGLYADTNLHYQIKNLKAVIERASTSFNGATEITAYFDDVTDGSMKLSHVTRVIKEQPSSISLGLHEFAGLPVKNALESWMTGTYDIKSQHGHYFGNLGIPGGWCLANHTMSILVVQVDPSWQTIQDAAFYYNMFPESVPFDHFEWNKGEHSIVSDYTITFRCNEERSPMIMYAAERYMNNRILSMVATSVYNSRQFVVTDFYDKDTPQEYAGYNQLMNQHYGENNGFIDHTQYNMSYSDANWEHDSGAEKWTGKSAVEKRQTDEKDANLIINKASPNDKYISEDGSGTKYYLHSHERRGSSQEVYNPIKGYSESN